MLLKLRIPKTLIWVIHIAVIYLALFSFYRMVTMIAFRPEDISAASLWPSFLLGLRYDLRWISFILLPIVLASLIPAWSPFFTRKNRKVWTWYLALMTFVVIFFFAADYSCFSYNKTRLNASALNFAEDPGISAKMIWQSYPIIWMVLGLVMAVLLLRQTFRMLHANVVSRTDGKGIPHQRKWFLVAGFALAMLAYGNIGKPLYWNEAFRSNDSFRSYLALNPLQNFFTTLRLRKPQYNESRARAYFPVMRDYLGLNAAVFNFKRTQPGAAQARPNVILIMCESFSMYKSSMSGNPLNTTPYFQSLCRNGLFFDRCFTPHFSTARGLFATLTGIPDVQLSKFSTRNPDALDQHTIINDFNGYSRHYFLGGSPEFNNFEGLIKNIHNVQMHVEGSFHESPLNVWGISDKDLFHEANTTLGRDGKPFFAVIQSSDNHRPYTIPNADTAFCEHPALDSLNKYGFESDKEYNAFRYFDHAVQSFMEEAKKQPWFNQTIFVFVGDHGVSGDASAMYPDVWTRERLTEEHVPLLFYAPALIRPQARHEVVSQIDVLPTVAGLAGQTCVNSTLGRNLVDPSKKQPGAFIILHDEGRIGIVTGDYFFTRNINFKKEELHKLTETDTLNPAQREALKNKLAILTDAYYATAQWMLLHNRKGKAER